MRKYLGLYIFAAAVLGWASYLAFRPAEAQGPIVGPGQPILCTGIATLAVGSTGLTQIVAASTGKAIYICGWHVTNTAASGTFLLASGTGSNCGTNGATLIPATNVTNTAPSADHQSYASFQTAVSQAFCINPSVNTISAVVYFSQF